MRPTLPALVALLIAVATVASGAPAPLPVGSDAGPVTGPAAPQNTPSQQSLAAPISSVENTSDYLSLTGQSRAKAEFGNATLDVTGTVAMESGRLQTAFNETVTLRAFESADSSASRTAIIRRTANRTENRTETLQNRQQRAVAAYNRGDLTTESFLQRLAVIDAEARQLDGFIENVLDRASGKPGYSLPNPLRVQLESNRAGPAILQGTVQNSIGRSLSGEADAFSVYVETTADGIVISRLSGNRYVREAFLASEYQQPGPDQFAQDDQHRGGAAFDRAQALYPWSFENVITVPSATGYGRSAIYQISVDHTQGRLVTYIDGTTTNVFRETQEKRLSRLPIASNATNNTTALSMTANLTHESGPMNIDVVDRETDEPVDARITVNDQFVGQTGTDGTLWTIRPYGPVTINATTSSGDRVTLDLDG